MAMRLESLARVSWIRKLMTNSAHDTIYLSIGPYAPELLLRKLQ